MGGATASGQFGAACPRHDASHGPPPPLASLGSSPRAGSLPHAGEVKESSDGQTNKSVLATRSHSFSPRAGRRSGCGGISAGLQTGGNGPHPDCFAIRPLPQAGEVKESRYAQANKIVLAAHARARVLLTTTTPSQKNRLASGNKRGKRSAERRMPSMSADRRQVRANLRYSSATRLRALSGARPPFGAHACGTRHRLSPRWLSPGTGFPEDRLRECFARSALLSSVKHAPCRPVLLPVDRGPRAARERMAYPRAGTAPRFRLSGLPSGKAPSLSEVMEM